MHLPMRLETLPVDISIQIQKHLDARDLIALRKSCKRLHAITQQRIVWLNALRRTCGRHGVFAPSFPLRDMSITELEHASLCPSRLSSLIHNEIPLRSFVTRILEPRTPSVIRDCGWDFNCLSAILIPGGRFLVVDSWGHGICLWDLGIHARKVPEFSPIAVIPEENRRSLCTGPIQDSLGIMLISYSCSGSGSTLFAHEIYPCTSNPQFILVGSLTCREETYRVGWRPACQFGDLLVFDTMPDCIVVWNVRLGEAIAWRCSESIRDILISHDNVILVQKSKLSVWDIPPLQPLLEGTYEIVNHAPKYETTHPFPFSNQPSKSSVLGPWLSSMDLPIPLGICGPKDRFESVMVCYALRSIDPSRDPTLPMVLPVEMGTVLDLPGEANKTSNIKFSGSLQYCEDELCYISLSYGTLFISLITPPTSLNGPSFSITTEFLSTRSDPLSWSFCAVSGRLVVVEDEGDIRIMDFLMPPP